MRKFLVLGVLVVTALALGAFITWQQPNARASSHREAPMIAGDPQADGTDFYMFVSPDKPGYVTFIANYYPFQDPNGGPNFYPFGDDVLYRINIDNNGDAVADITYDFTFKTTVKNGNTFLYNTGPIDSLTSPNRNVVQTYTVTRTDKNGSVVRGKDLPMPPANIGPKSTPNYDALAQAAVHTYDNGAQTFAGQRDDPFFVDLGATFDLLTIRPGPPGNHGGGVDDLSGMNVNTIALQLPFSSVTANGAMPAAATDPHAVIGGWTTSYRRSTRVLTPNGKAVNSGAWVQVSRLGNPLVNEVVVPLAYKDLWNASKPANDAQFAGGVTDPEVPKLLHAIYGLNVPPAPRNDLVTIFLTGIGKVPGLLPDGLNQPANVKGAEELRLNLMVPAKGCNQGANRLGLLALDVGGFPNGRRLCDDVVDIALQAMAGGTPFTPQYNVAPNNQLGDGVDCNPIKFLDSFPYVASPENGFSHQHHALNIVCP